MDWLSQHARPIADSILYSVIGGGTMLFLFWIVEALTPFSLRKEVLEKQNLAVGAILGAFLIALAIIVAAAIGG